MKEPAGYGEMRTALRFVESYFGSEVFVRAGDPDFAPVHPVEQGRIRGHVGFISSFLEWIESAFGIELARPDPITYGQPFRKDPYVRQGIAYVDGLIDAAKRFRRLNKGDESMVAVAEVVINRAAQLKGALGGLAAKMGVEPPLQI